MEVNDIGDAVLTIAHSCEIERANRTKEGNR